MKLWSDKQLCSRPELQVAAVLRAARPESSSVPLLLLMVTAAGASCCSSDVGANTGFRTLGYKLVALTASTGNHLIDTLEIRSCALRPLRFLGFKVLRSHFLRSPAQSAPDRTANRRADTALRAGVLSRSPDAVHFCEQSRSQGRRTTSGARRSPPDKRH